jgi:hypothetical protein
MHLHLVTFMQTTEGIQALIRSMDSSNITKCAVFGCPVEKKWSYEEPDKPTYYLDDNARRYQWPATDEMLAYEYLKLATDERDRISPMLSGRPGNGVAQFLRQTLSPIARISIGFLEPLFVFRR